MRNPLSLEAFSDWCAKQPADKEYNFFNCRGCALFQYFSDVGLPIVSIGGLTWGDTDGRRHTIPDELRTAFHGAPKNTFNTFGKLAAKLRA